MHQDRVPLFGLGVAGKGRRHLTWGDGVCPHLHHLVPARVVPVRLCESLHAEVACFTDGYEALLEGVGNG